MTSVFKRNDTTQTKLILCAFLAYLTILASPCFSAAEETLKKNECFSIGRASVVKGNVSRAKTAAIRNALEKGAPVGPCILKGTKAAAEPALKPLSVTLTGVTEPRQFHMFTDFLKTQMHGIKSVVPTCITHNSMSATVEFRGNRITFISDVLNHQSLPFPLYLGQTDTENIIFSLE